MLAVSAYCLQHLTIQGEASRCSVRFTGPQKWDADLRAERKTTLSTGILSDCHQCVAIYVIPSLQLEVSLRLFFSFLQFLLLS